MHRSFDPTTNEHHIDNFNIDFIRYFSKKNIIANVIGSVVASILFFTFDIYNIMMSWKINLLFLYFFGMAFIFAILLFLAHRAGNSLRGSLSLTTRRGLFSYIVLSFVLVVSMMISGDISFLDPFGRLYHILLTGQMFVAMIAVPIDLFSTFSLKD
jgi:hypothetical protein